ncbi:hypothetical protein [Sulfitobacter dubius]|uniref:hypothetical protein n=1 Tax=Sulfitobacter dubius TaxID=218673 RepID=UPI002941CB66|nr:hypothetical protein [Sulfitobacter dubius]WOI30754.1 hypothetical protein R1T39_17025 [Sulfitobacter dubius]
MTQAIALAAVQDVIAAQYPALSIDLVAQVHYVRPHEIAHIDVYGCDDTTRRRAIRQQAVSLLRQLGIRVELIGGHDVYTVSPDRSERLALQGYADRLYLFACSEAGTYVDPQRLSAPLRERVDAQVARQRPLINGREYYYANDVEAALEGHR